MAKSKRQKAHEAGEEALRNMPYGGSEILDADLDALTEQELVEMLERDVIRAAVAQRRLAVQERRGRRPYKALRPACEYPTVYGPCMLRKMWRRGEIYPRPWCKLHGGLDYPQPRRRSWEMATIGPGWQKRLGVNPKMRWQDDEVTE